jgi:hypothetical protein
MLHGSIHRRTDHRLERQIPLTCGWLPPIADLLARIPTLLPQIRTWSHPLSMLCSSSISLPQICWLLSPFRSSTSIPPPDARTAWSPPPLLRLTAGCSCRRQPRPGLGPWPYGLTFLCCSTTSLRRRRPAGPLSLAIPGRLALSSRLAPLLAASQTAQSLAAGPLSSVSPTHDYPLLPTFKLTPSLRTRSIIDCI